MAPSWWITTNLLVWSFVVGLVVIYWPNRVYSGLFGTYPESTSDLFDVNFLHVSPARQNTMFEKYRSMQHVYVQSENTNCSVYYHSLRSYDSDYGQSFCSRRQPAAPTSGALEHRVRLYIEQSNFKPGWLHRCHMHLPRAYKWQLWIVLTLIWYGDNHQNLTSHMHCIRPTPGS